MSSRKGQSFLEYAVLICVIVSSLLIMQVYVKRSYQGRLKQEADNLGPQYSPTHTTSLIRTVSGIDSRSYTGGNISGVTVPDGVSVTYSNTSTSYIRCETVDSFAAP